MDASGLLELDLQNFRCLRCGECCRQTGFVYLSQEEADGIAGYLGKTPFDFINEFCDLQDRRKLVLRKIEGEKCIFDSGTKGCQIHAVKPGQCRDFPVRWRTERSDAYCAGLRALGAPGAAALFRVPIPEDLKRKSDN